MVTYEKQYRVVNKKTGEVVYESSRGFYPPRFDGERGYLFWNQKTFAKQFSDVTFPEGMSILDCGRLARLAKSIWGNSNVLVSKERGAKKPIEVDEIGKTIELSARNTDDWLRRMNEMGVIAFSDVTLKGRTERLYYVNPLYFFSSNRMPLALYLMFREDLDKHLPMDVRGQFAGQEKEKHTAGMSREDILAEAFERGLRGKKEDGCEMNEVAGE